MRIGGRAFYGMSVGGADGDPSQFDPGASHQRGNRES